MSNLAQLLMTQLNQHTHHLSTTFLSIPPSCTRFLSSIFTNPKLNYYINPYNNNGIFHVRGFSSVSTAPLPVVPHSHHLIRQSCGCVCFPSLSVHPLCRSRASSIWFSVMSLSDDHQGPTAPQETAKTVRCVIKGRVQGVFYRNWTVENAMELGVKGWVRNRRDGSVEALFSGKTEVVDEMMQRCRRGPPDAMVTAFEASPCNDDPGAGFERRSTV